MSILIKGMEMPKNCYECPLMMSVFVFKCDSNMCSITKGGCIINSRPPHCPLVEVPKHGRLIDADALKADIQEHADIFANCGHLDLAAMAQRDGLLCAVGDVVNAPTIIEAEGEDGKV